jgi:Ca2+-binding EF-hand superfamily protein
VAGLLTLARGSFGQTLFSRFIKEMVHAADANHDGKLTFNEVRQLLKNIGASPNAIPASEWRALVEEVGRTTGSYEEGASEDEWYLDVDLVQEMILGKQNRG